MLFIFDLHIANVALEMLYVDWIEADDRCEQTDICFRDVRRGKQIRRR